MDESNKIETNGVSTPIPLFANVKAVFSNLLGFLDEKKFSKQLEKRIIGRENVGFVDRSFEQMMRKIGWKSSEAWCAYYVKLVFMNLFSFDRKWLEINLTGSAVGNYDTIKKLNKKGDNRYIAFTKDKLQVGDVFCLGVVGEGHTGIILQVLNEEKNFCLTIEGNTSSKGSREGDQIKKLERILTFGRRSGSKKVIGFYRRNFTEKELKNLRYDEVEDTFVFD